MAVPKRSELAKRQAKRIRRIGKDAHTDEIKEELSKAEKQRRNDYLLRLFKK